MKKSPNIRHLANEVIALKKKTNILIGAMACTWAGLLVYLFVFGG